jgi:hypothetical protein
VPSSARFTAVATRQQHGSIPIKIPPAQNIVCVLHSRVPSYERSHSVLTQEENRSQKTKKKNGALNTCWLTCVTTRFPRLLPQHPMSTVFMQTYFAAGDEHRRGALTLLVLATLAAAVVGSSGLDGAAVATPSFTIQNDQFIRDGKPFQIMSACVHYFRIRPEYWADRWVGWTLACKGSRDSWGSAWLSRERRH